MVKGCLIDSELLILNIDDHDQQITSARPQNANETDGSIPPDDEVDGGSGHVYGADANFKELAGSVGFPHQIWQPKELIKNKYLHESMEFIVDEDGFQQEVKCDVVNFIVWTKYYFKGKAAFDFALKEAEEQFWADHQEEQDLGGAASSGREEVQSEEGVNHDRVGATPAGQKVVGGGDNEVSA